MQTILPTHLLYLLHKKNILESRLKHIRQSSPFILYVLDNLLNDGVLVLSGEDERGDVSALLQSGLVTTDPSMAHQKDKETGFPKTGLYHLKWINCELTYRCNNGCSHCIQSSTRCSGNTGDLSTEKWKNIINLAWFCGFTEEGINMTGGEPLEHREDIFDIIGHASSMKIPIRLNSSGWWGDKEDFTTGGRRFFSANHLVAFLKEAGLSLFAFSYDLRYEKDKQDIAPLLKSIEACERNKLPYQIIFSGFSDDHIKRSVTFLKSNISSDGSYMVPVNSPIVDIGAAATLPDVHFQEQNNACTCGLKGFYRPTILHINPEGKARTCRSALGLGNAGDLDRTQLVNLVNSFQSDRVVRSFSDAQTIGKYYKVLYEPFIKLYKRFRHGCIMNVVMARLIETYDGYVRNGAIDKLVLIKNHMQIGEELNILVEGIEL